MQTQERKPLSWKARRNGELYCAPACGRGCTRKEYERAVRKANALAKKCAKEVGGTWVTRVHENLGWHYEVTLKGGNLTIHPRTKGIYSVASNVGGTPVQISVRETSGSIKELVEKQLALVRAEAAKWNSYLQRNQVQLLID